MHQVAIGIASAWVSLAFELSWSLKQSTFTSSICAFLFAPRFEVCYVFCEMISVFSKTKWNHRSQGVVFIV